MTTIYFIKAEYSGNTYQLSDFYTGTAYKQDPNKKMDVDMAFNDGIGTLITQIKRLPDSTSIRDYTHILIPSKMKIYKISAIDDLNYDSAIIYLEDDPFIANYQEIQNTNIIVSRTNDPTKFIGINDTEDYGVEYTNELVKIQNNRIATGVNNIFGKWLMIMIQRESTPSASPEREINIILRSTRTIDITVADSDELYALYPSVYGSTPTIDIPYYNKIATYKENGSDVYLEFVYNIGENRSSWRVIDYDPVPGVKYTLHDRDLAVPIIGTPTYYILVLPYSSSIAVKQTEDYAARDRLINARDFVGFGDHTIIYSTRIIDSTFLPINSYEYATVDGKLLNYINTDMIWHEAAGKSGKTALTVPTNLNQDLYLPYSIGTNSNLPTDAEPFNKYSLNVYGNVHDIPWTVIRTNKLKLKMIHTLYDIYYLVYIEDQYGKYTNTIANGTLQPNVIWQIDAQRSFAAENPTYKDQFMLQSASNIVKTIGGAVVGGVMTGGIALPAIAGAVGGAADSVLGYANLGLEEKGRRLAADINYGQIGSIHMDLSLLYGIFYIKRTPKNYHIMRDTYRLRGFPITTLTKISNLTGDTVFGTTYPIHGKLVYGKLINTIKNNYVTGAINTKLQEGVILI